MIKARNKTYKQTTTKQTNTVTTYNRLFFTSQIEMLSGNCSKLSTSRAYIPCPTVAIVK